MLFKTISKLEKGFVRNLDQGDLIQIHKIECSFCGEYEEVDKYTLEEAIDQFIGNGWQIADSELYQQTGVWCGNCEIEELETEK